MPTQTPRKVRPPGQPMEALALANVRRLEKAAVRRAIRSNDLRLHEAIMDPPECLRSSQVLDILRMGRFVGNAKLARIGREAMRAGVNLAVPLGWLSPDQRRWLARRV